MNFNVRAYGVCISIVSESVFKCCGATQLKGFQVKGDDSELTPEQCQKLLVQLYRKVRISDVGRKVLTAADALGPRGWSPGLGDSSRTDRLSLEAFCTVNGFKKMDGGVGAGTHEICVYVDHPRYFMGDNIKEKPIPKEQDFSDDTRPAAASRPDIDALCNAILELVQ